MSREHLAESVAKDIESRLPFYVASVVAGDGLPLRVEAIFSLERYSAICGNSSAQQPESAVSKMTIFPLLLNTSSFIDAGFVIAVRGTCLPGTRTYLVFVDAEKNMSYTLVEPV